MSTEELYREIVEGSSDGIWVFDLSGATIYANPTLARMFGVTQEEFTRLTVFDSLDDEGKEQFAAHLRELGQGRAQERDLEAVFVRSDGTRIWVLVGETLLRGPDGEITGVLHRLTDYDARRALVDRLTASRQELADSQRIARLGSWTWNLETDELVGSEALYRLYGLTDPEAPVPYADFLARVHPDDVTEVDAAVERARTMGGEFMFVARIRTDDDNLVWTRGRGVAHRDESGRVVSMTGTHQDITETRKAELALEDQVAQNMLMQAVASAANEASTLNEVLGQARTLVLLHDDWRRARGFGRSPDGSGRLEPMYLDEQDRLDDLDTPEEAALELALADRAAESRTLLWDDNKLTVAFPVMYGDEVHAVITITSRPPLYRYDLIESFVRQSAVQLTRVVERELAERALADARDAAMEASRQKSEFLARMSHEIRTPLNGVIGLNELLLRTDMDGEQLRLASGVKAASRSLLDLINDILDFSKIEAGMLELERVSFDIREVLDQATAVLSESADARDITLTVDCDVSVPTLVAGDPVRLGQVVMNLGANAVKFTPQGRVGILASATEQDGHVVLRVDVTDTGVGVEGLDLESLFESFHQGDASTTRVHGGTGLGLAISREIVEAMGGEIGAEARPQGGSLFWFTVTLDAIDEADTSVPRWHAERGTGLAVGRASVDGVRRRILVVEDNPVNQVVAVGLLRSLGYDADTADDGAAGVSAWADGCYDLVLMDVQMPRMDGYAATREIRRNEPEGRRVPVLAMTAAAIQGERERCLEAGMDDFLTKPVDVDALAAALARWLGGDAPAARVAPPAREPVADGLDRDRLDMLRDMADGDTAYLDRAIGRFVTGTPDLVGAIGAAVDAGDVDDLRQQAHRLAGSALNLGVTRVGTAARALEHLADTGTTAGADDLLPRLAEAVDADCAALLSYQQGYQVSDG